MAIRLEPSDTLSFALRKADVSTQSSLILKNESATEHVIFKVKTTRPLRYLVRPNQGVIGPNGTATIVLILQSKDVNDLMQMPQNERALSNDKFLVQSSVVDAEFCESITKASTDTTSSSDSNKATTDSLNAKWGTVAKADTVNKKLKCEFLEDALSVKLPTGTTSSPPGSSSTSVGNKSANAAAVASPSEDDSKKSKEGQFVELATMRKKYDELVSFTVQLTAQRDKLVSELDEKNFKLKKALEGSDAGLRLRKQKNDSEGGGGAASSSSGGDDEDLSSSNAMTTPSNASFSLFHLAVVAFIFFLIGRFYY